MKADPIIHIENLEIGFGNKGQYKAVVKDFSLTIYRNEIVALVGESGSGKTITALSIVGLVNNAIIPKGEINYVSKTEGFVNLNGLNTKEFREFRGRKIACIFQEPLSSLNPLKTCENQIFEALSKSASIVEKRKKVRKLLSQVGILEPDRVALSYPHQLSGGQRQRVMIAMALAFEPELIIADEPTTALDPLVQQEVLTVLKNINKDLGTAILFITHDMALVKSFSEAVAVMYRGQLMEYGPTQELFLNPKSNYTQALIQTRANPDNKEHRLPELNELMEGKVVDGNFRFNVSDTVKMHVQKLKVFYEGKEALVIDELKVYKGECFGVIGPSGSGKSTFAKALVHLVELNADKVILDDLSLISWNYQTACKLQMIFQDPFSALNPKQRVGKMLTEVLRQFRPKMNKTERQVEINRLLNEVGLAPADASKYPHEFSGGQRQRVCIARALAVGAEVLILDESLSALDVSVQAKILNLLNKLREEKGLTYIFISHDINVVGYFCDRVMVLDKGKVVESGSVDKIIRNPESQLTNRLVKAGL